MSRNICPYFADAFAVLTIGLLSGSVCAFVGCGPANVPDQIRVQTDGVAQNDGVLTGSDVLRRSEEAYALLSSYVGTIEITSTTTYDRFTDETPEGTFTIAFVRPDKLRLDGKDTNGDPLILVSNAEATWELVVGELREHEPHHLKDSLVTFTGTTRTASKVLPGILLGMSWSRETFFFPQGRLLSAFATKAELVGKTQVDDHECFEVVCVRDIATWTFAVDAKSYLIRRVSETSSQDQMAQQRRLGGGGRTGKIIGSKDVQHFKIESVNGPVDPALFARPSPP